MPSAALHADGTRAEWSEHDPLGNAELVQSRDMNGGHPRRGRSPRPTRPSSSTPSVTSLSPSTTPRPARGSRQIIHGGNGYDDPIEVAVAEGTSGVGRLYPIFDEAGAGTLRTATTRALITRKSTRESSRRVRR